MNSEPAPPVPPDAFSGRLPGKADAQAEHDPGQRVEPKPDQEPAPVAGKCGKDAADGHAAISDRDIDDEKQGADSRAQCPNLVPVRPQDRAPCRSGFAEDRSHVMRGILQDAAAATVEIVVEFETAALNRRPRAAGARVE